MARVTLLVLVISCALFGPPKSAVCETPSSALSQQGQIVLSNKYDGPLKVENNVVLNGLVVGSVTVLQNGYFEMHGTVTNDLIVQPGAMAKIFGTVVGTVINYGGSVEVRGMVGSISDRGDSQTVVYPEAVVKERSDASKRADLPKSDELPPRYDVAAQCKEVAAVGGTYSAVTENGCFKIEQSAYDTLKAMWPGLSKAVRKNCDEVARFGGNGSYTTLLGCIQMEQNAQLEMAERKFKY